MRFIEAALEVDGWAWVVCTVQNEVLDTTVADKAFSQHTAVAAVDSIVRQVQVLNVAGG